MQQWTALNLGSGGRSLLKCTSLLKCMATNSMALPNMVLILADDLGYHDVSYHGGNVPTPHIDAIAMAGIRFPAAYASSTLCSPSRAVSAPHACAEKVLYFLC